MAIAVNDSTTDSPVKEDSSAKLPTVILISGTGSNMRHLIELAHAGELPIQVKAVISDRSDAAGLVTANRLGVATAALNPKTFNDRPQFDTALKELIDSHAPQLIVLAGFMRILGPDFIRHFCGRLLNIHPSLLPHYPGLHTHRRALAAGDAEHGATVHFVTEELDGGPRIVRARVPILSSDNEASLSVRVQQQEHQIYPQAVRWFATGRLKFAHGKAFLDNQELVAPVEVCSDIPA